MEHDKEHEKDTLNKEEQKQDNRNEQSKQESQIRQNNQIRKTAESYESSNYHEKQEEAVKPQQLKVPSMHNLMEDNLSDKKLEKLSFSESFLKYIIQEEQAKLPFKKEQSEQAAY